MLSDFYTVDVKLADIAGPESIEVNVHIAENIPRNDAGHIRIMLPIAGQIVSIVGPKKSTNRSAIVIVKPQNRGSGA